MDDLFPDDRPPNKREDALRGEMTRRLREPWNPQGLPGMIEEPADAAKLEFVEAFVRASRPRSR
jgi:hypothetical protein